jgi:hypothetical protein
MKKDTDPFQKPLNPAFLRYLFQKRSLPASLHSLRVMPGGKESLSGLFDQDIFAPA